MPEDILTLHFDINNCYLIRSNGTILIDGGPPGKGKSFKRQLANYGIDPHEIKLIVLTHGDFDHIGSARDFKELTGAKLAIHKNDLGHLEKGEFHWPKGFTFYGKISRFLMKPFFANIKIPATNADVVLDDMDFPLNEFGINGKIVFTPGHSPGSVSVILNSGVAFAGCLAHNRFPFTLKPKFPIYGEDLAMIKDSWKVLIQNGARIIYPGHGKPFPVEQILHLLNSD